MLIGALLSVLSLGNPGGVPPVVCGRNGLDDVRVLVVGRLTRI